MPSVGPGLDEAKGRRWGQLAWVASESAKSCRSLNVKLSVLWGELCALQNKGFYAINVTGIVTSNEQKQSCDEISHRLILLCLLWVVLTSHMPHCSRWTNIALILQADTCGQPPLSCGARMSLQNCDFGAGRLSLKSSHFKLVWEHHNTSNPLLLNIQARLSVW